MATAVAEGDTGRIAPVRPYGPSWVDRLETLVVRIPGPTSVGYVVVALAGTAIVNGILWLAGSLVSGPYTYQATIAHLRFVHVGADAPPRP
jgi:hypothetical protein